MPLDGIKRLDDCPALAPLLDEQRELVTEQRRLFAELDAVRGVLNAPAQALEHPQAVTPTAARSRMRALEQELAASRDAMADCTARLETARQVVKASLRPQQRREETQHIRRLLAAAEEALTAQQAYQRFEGRMRRLGLTGSSGAHVDPMLEARVQRMRLALARLQD